MINLYCDHCDVLVDENVSGGVRLKMGRREYVFHLCAECQELLRKEIKETFLLNRTWREVP